MGIEQLSDAVVQRPDIQAFFPKVKLVPVDEYDSRDPAHSPRERVIIKLTNGNTLDTGEITSVRGHAFDPLTTEELWQKFRECTTKTHNETSAKTLFERTQALPELMSTGDLPSVEGLFVPHIWNRGEEESNWEEAEALVVDAL
jgi:2-methylcitrate dehydratase PrpD